LERVQDRPQDDNQRLFEQFFEAAPDASLIVDERGKILQMNRQAENHFGYPRQEVIGRGVEVLIPARFSRRHVRLRGQYHQNPVTRAMGAGLSLLGRRKDGSEFPVDVTLSPIALEGETHVIAVVRDITTRVDAERVIRKQNSHVKLLQDIATAANGTDSLQDVLQLALDRVCEVLGWSVGHAILLQPDASLRSTRVWHLDQPEVFTPFRALSETLDYKTFGGLPNLISRTGKAASFWDVHQHPEFRRSAEAKIGGLVGAFSFPILSGRDVVGVLEFFSRDHAEIDPPLVEVMTNIGVQLGRVIERTRAREALRRSEARFRTIFEKSAIGIQVSDAEGYILDTNPALQEMLGFSALELQRLALTEITHPQDLETNWALLQSLLRGERSSYQTQTRHIHKNGGMIWTELTVSSVTDAQGKTQFVVMLVRDISELKRKSVELDEVQRKLVESAEKERISLARELHDGPLQDLYGASFSLQDFLSELSDTQDTTGAVNANRMMQEVIGRLRGICDGLRPPTLGPFGLEKAIRSQVERLELLYPHIHIHQELMSDRQTFHERARLVLFRIYQQLISNVLRHAHASNVWIRLRFDEQLVELEVEDDGQGFTLPTRWVELAREGHVGLLGVLERVEAFGGTVEVLRGSQGGACVRVRVPRERISRLDTI
jgi:PAS domain S-box-containing protein